MNATPVEPLPWSRRQWVYAISAGLAVQVALVLYFGGRPPPRPPAPRFTTHVYSATDPWSAEQLAVLPTLSDPTLFALPSVQGFSGSAWLLFAPLEHQLTDWTEPARWLALEPGSLGESFAALADRTVTEPLLIGDKPLPRPTGLDVPIPNEPFATQPRLRVEGELAGRPLLSHPELPPWPTGGLLSNTVVQVVIDGTGDVLATTLLAESGSKEADAHALKQAAAVRFEPLRSPDPKVPPDRRLCWGRLVFQWVASPPAAAPRAANPP